MSIIKFDMVVLSRDFAEEVGLPDKKYTVEEFKNELAKRNTKLKMYKLTEIERCIEDKTKVVLVAFEEMYGGYEYCFCEDGVYIEKEDDDFE